MKRLISFADLIAPPRGAPILILIAIGLALAIADHGSGYVLRISTIFSITQLFATLGLIALGLGLVMIAGEYDLSVAGVLAASGAIAVLTGKVSPAFGLFCAVMAGLLIGLAQGMLVVWLRISAISLTLGGLLVLLGITYVLADGSTIAYTGMSVTQWLQEPILGGLMSRRGGVVSAVFALCAIFMALTRTGRDIVAVGSNRAGARAAGVNTSAILVGVFALSGALSALGGALLSYSLAAASAIGLSDVLVPATAAAIIGGVSLGGGKGRPTGIAAGVLSFCALRSGLSAMGIHPFMLDTITGCILLTVAMIDAPRFGEAIKWLRTRTGLS